MTSSRSLTKPRKKPVEDQVVVLLGASSGIGRASALRFAAAGARVVAARGRPGLDLSSPRSSPSASHSSPDSPTRPRRSSGGSSRGT